MFDKFAFFCYNINRKGAHLPIKFLASRNKKQQKNNLIIMDLKAELSKFEIAVGVIIGIGLVLLGITSYNFLQPQQQRLVSEGWGFLDIHEEATETFGHLRFAYSVPATFADEFYKAFTEVAVLPPSIFDFDRSAKETYIGFLNYSEMITADYQATQLSLNKQDHLGQVLGISLEPSSIQECGTDNSQEKINEADSFIQHQTGAGFIPYSYEPITFKDLEKLRKLMPKY